jgi:hypothetical protein
LGEIDKIIKAMKKYIIFLLSLLFSFTTVFITAIILIKRQSVKPKNLTSNMQLTSPAFEDKEKIPEKYTCDGENVNPPLVFSDIPEKTQSLALIVDDPDAAAGTWVHWLMWNIDPGIRGIKEDDIPDTAIEGTTSFGSVGYGGPCPPSGTHRYFFKLYALDTTLDLPESALKEDLEVAMEGHILDEAELIGIYHKRGQ